jgi:aminopeptidase N
MKSSLYLIFFLPSLSMAFQQPNLEAVDIKHYHFTIDLNDTTDVISGKAIIRLQALKPLNEVEFDLISKTADGKGMVVSDLKLEEKQIKFTHAADRLKVSFGETVQTGKVATLTVFYRGIPKDGLIISKNMFGDRTFFADNWPNRGRNWLPVVDHPADKAAVDFTVLAPVHYEVVANGIKVEEVYLDEKQKMTSYREETPIGTKVMVIGVARFAIQRAGTVNNIPVESWVYPQLRKEGFYDYSVAVRVLDFFISHVGPYSYKKLANVQSKTTFGGLENASAIFYSEKSVTGRNESETLIAHEIAHQWFGNSASEKEWHHLWLSEGFATYFAHLYNEFTFGTEKRQDEMKEDREQVLAYFKKNPAPVVDKNITNLMKLLNVNNYQKGSWVLHMLRREIGDQAFWNGIREYYRQYQNSNALTSDLQRVMQDVSGKNLEVFFSQWIFKDGHPVLNGEWKYDEASKKVVITINQVQKGQIFVFPLEIGVYEAGKAAPRIEAAYINRAPTQVTFPADTKPSKISLDPYINLLFEGNLKN